MARKRPGARDIERVLEETVNVMTAAQSDVARWSATAGAAGSADRSHARQLLARALARLRGGAPHRQVRLPRPGAAVPAPAGAAAPGHRLTPLRPRAASWYLPASVVHLAPSDAVPSGSVVLLRRCGGRTM